MTAFVPSAGVFSGVSMGPAAPQTVGPAVDDSIKRNADFGARSYRAVAGRTDDNVSSSPFAVSAGMLASSSGAGGPTQTQSSQGLTSTGSDPQSSPDSFQTSRNAVLQTSPSSNLQQGTAFFSDRRFQVPAAFQDSVQTQFGGKVQSVSYASPSDAVDAINRWVSDSSADQGQDVSSSSDPQTQSSLFTAASYQMRFSPSFNSSSTQDERFYVDKYHVVMVPMMFRADKYFSAYDGAVKAGVSKSPSADGAAMSAVSPDEDVDVTAVEDQLTAETIRAWIRRSKKTKSEVQLPVFQAKRSYPSKDVLQTSDISQVFQEDADLSNMGGASGARLSQVYHVSAAVMDDSSDDVSSGGGATVFSSPPPRLTFNRPFIYVIYQESSGSLLFIGRVVNPTEK